MSLCPTLPPLEQVFLHAARFEAACAAYRVAPLPPPDKLEVFKATWNNALYTYDVVSVFCSKLHISAQLGLQSPAWQLIREAGLTAELGRVPTILLVARAALDPANRCSLLDISVNDVWYRGHKYARFPLVTVKAPTIQSIYHVYMVYTIYYLHVFTTPRVHVNI